MITIPNIITSFRIIIVPFLLTLLYSNFENKLMYITILILISGISDISDGFIARRFNMKSKLGAILDPFADKLMQLAVLLCLLYFKWIPLGLLLFICCKEVILCIGALYLLKKGVHVQSDKSGKFATFVFYLCTFVFVLCDPNVTIKFVLYVLMVITALYALIDYSSIFVDNTNIFKRNEKND